MKIKIISVGKIKDPSINALVNDFVKRISFDAKISQITVKDSDPEGEGKKLLKHMEDCFSIVMSEEGSSTDSVGFSEMLKKHQEKELCFVIGGPYGLSDAVKKKADVLLSLSKMTFTHEMAKLFLCEQLYRAISIIKGRPYHKT